MRPGTGLPAIGLSIPFPKDVKVETELIHCV